MTTWTGSFTAKLTASLVLLVSLAGCSVATAPVSVPAPVVSSPAAPAAPAAPSAPVSPSAPAAASSTTSDLLATLPVKGRAPKTGYDREAMFGTAWVDVDRNGCDTRNDILARDLTDEVLSGPCKVLSGSLADPYTGQPISFVRGNKTSTLVQIDHVVALMNAWETGAQQLSQESRVAFANDPLNLRAADGPANSAKGAGDAATWLPANKAFRCEYVSAQVQVKAKYGLWVTQAEHDAIAGVLANCAPSAAAAPAAPVAPAPAAEAAPVVDEPAVAPAPAGNVHPGSFCDAQGATGTADNGKTYTCGTKGPDAAGRLHWNA